MRALIQVNKNFSQQQLNPLYGKANEVQEELDSIYFTGDGGSPGMKISNKTIPPIKNDIGAKESQIKIKDSNTNQINLARSLNRIVLYSDFYNEFTKNNLIEIRTPFRILILYSELEKNYFAPRISIREKPYGFSSSEIPQTTGSVNIDIVYLNNYPIPQYGSLKENEIFCKYIAPGDIIVSSLFNIRFNVLNVQSLKNTSNIEYGKRITIAPLDTMTSSISRGEKFIIVNKYKEIISEYSFGKIINNIPVSPFRFMQVSLNQTDFTNAFYDLDLSKYSENEYIGIYNNEYFKPLDLIGLNKIAIASELDQINFKRNFTVYNLGANLNPQDTVIKLTSTSGLQKGDYLTIIYDDHTNIYEEVVKIIDILNNSDISVERKKFNTPNISATTSAVLYKAKPIYFQLSFLSDSNMDFYDFYYDTVFLVLDYL